MTAPVRARLPFILICVATVVAVAVSLDRVHLAHTWSIVEPNLRWTVPLNIGFAAIAWRARVVTLAAALAGGTIAWLLLAAFGWGAWLVIGFALVLTAAATRVGHTRKSQAGIAEARHGQRGVANIIANTGTAGVAAMAALCVGDPALPALVAVASLATSVGDTVATEIGQASRGTPRLVTSWRRVRAGTPGAVSAQGLGAGASAAMLVALMAGATGMIAPRAIIVIAICAVVASLLEGVIAITAETRGWIDNDGVNLISSIIGAALSAAACVAVAAV